MQLVSPQAAPAGSGRPGTGQPVNHQLSIGPVTGHRARAGLAFVPRHRHHRSSAGTRPSGVNRAIGQRPIFICGGLALGAAGSIAISATAAAGHRRPAITSASSTVTAAGSGLGLGHSSIATSCFHHYLRQRANAAALSLPLLFATTIITAGHRRPGVRAGPGGPRQYRPGWQAILLSFAPGYR